MAAHCDRRNTRPILSRHNTYHGQTTTFQPPLPEQLRYTTPPDLPASETHGGTSLFSPSRAEIDIVTIPYYEGYTIRPDDLASSEERWSLPPKKSIPATQEDLHTEVMRQRQSGRTACRELEDCHGPKRQYIDRLIRERNASTTLGHFEVAQLRLERIPRDSMKASNRNSGRNYYGRDYKQKDSTKPRQKTVYMHIILQFMKHPNRIPAPILSEDFAARNLDVGNGHHGGRPRTLEEDIIVSPTAADDQPSMLPRAGQPPILARRYPYITGDGQLSFVPSSRYVSRGTQTTFQAKTRSPDDWCGGIDAVSATLEGTRAEDTWTTASDAEEEMPRKSPSSDDEAVNETSHESTEKKSTGNDDYEKPPWFQNLQPVKSPGLTDEQTDVFYPEDNGESSTPQEEENLDDACEQDDEEVLKAHQERNTGYAQPNVYSWSETETGRKSPGYAAEHTTYGDNDRIPDYTEHKSAPIVSGTRKLESIDEHPSAGATKVPMSEHLSNLPGPPPAEQLPPSERYKPRPPLNALPARPSLTRASATYDSRPIEDSERKSSKRVSFQQAQPPLYTPPSTSNSSPVSPVSSPQLPFRTILAKPPPVSIPPGQYTPIASSASSSSTSSSSPPAARKPYTCVKPTCDSSFDHPYDRDRHEGQHQIGDPPYSQCPICRYSRSSGAAVEGGLREMLVGHMSRKHKELLESANRMY